MLWIMAFHIIFVICWFAGLFYLPRLYVYHAMCEDETGNARFKIMERKLYYGIMTPSAVLTVVFGVWMVLLNPQYYMTAGWFHAKLTLVVLLIGYHFYCGKMLKVFARDANKHSHVFYRWFNEFPVLLLVGIVCLVVVKPF